MKCNKYQEFLKKIKEQIVVSQIKTALSLNSKLIAFYWTLGTLIQSKQEECENAIPLGNLARELRCDFPDIKGFSGRNINCMVQFAKEYPNEEIIPFVGQIPWSYNLILLQRIKQKEERFWYLDRTIANGWSQERLVHWINRGFYKRKGKPLTTLYKSFPPLQSDLVQEILTDPYCFDFLTFINTRKSHTKEVKLLVPDDKFIHVDCFQNDIGNFRHELDLFQELYDCSICDL